MQAPRGAYIWRGDLTEGFLRYEFGGLIFGILRYYTEVLVVQISSCHRTNYDYRVISGTGLILQYSNFFAQCAVALLVCSLFRD